MDVLPAIPDAESRRLLLEQRNLDAQWTDTSLAITDQRDPNFDKISPEWPHSNPKGFANWFAEQGGDVFRERRQAIFEADQGGVFESVNDVPMFRVKTPLQGVVQLLKRHRDMMFEHRSGPVAFSCRPMCSFKPLFVRKRRGFSSRVLSVGGADYKSR